MLNRLFPESLDNQYRGNRLALWLLFPITLVTIVRSCIHIFRFDGGAQSIATIPLDTHSSAGANTVITIFALWGLSQLVVGILYLVVLVRYRALIPLMYLLIVVEYSGRVGIGLMKPLATIETPPGAFLNLQMIAVGLACLILSLRWKSN